MFMPAIVLVVSMSLLLFYLHVFWQKFLRRRDSREFYQAIVNADRLEFPSHRKDTEDFESPGEYPHLLQALKCDFLVLGYLLKNAANVDQRHTYEQHLLILYFKVLYLSRVGLHWLGWY
jgi:hypothetical protein